MGRSSGSATVYWRGVAGAATPTLGHSGDGNSASGLGPLVRERRSRLRMTQHQLATRAGISLGAVRDIEQGRTVKPRPGSFARIATALNLSASEEQDALLSLARDRSGGDRPPRERGRGHTDSGLRFAALGPLAAWRDGVPLALGPVRQRAVLGLLLLHRNGLSRAALVDALWAQDPPPGAVAMLQAYITRLRHLLADSGSGRASAMADGHVVAWDGSGYRLASDLVRSDVADFGELTTRARHASGAGNADTACGIYEQALWLWRDDPLADVSLLGDHPAVSALNRERVAAVIEYADAADAAGSPGQALDQLRLLAQRQPWDERVHGRLMNALAATGQQAEALSVFEEMRLRLDRELGIRPDRELMEAHVRVLRQETRLDGAGLAGRAAGGQGVVVPCHLPALGTHFAGRAAELTELDRLLDRSDALQPLVISISGTATRTGQLADLELHHRRRLDARTASAMRRTPGCGTCRCTTTTRTRSGARSSPWPASCWPGPSCSPSPAPRAVGTPTAAPADLRLRRADRPRQPPPELRLAEHWPRASRSAQPSPASRPSDPADQPHLSHRPGRTNRGTVERRPPGATAGPPR
jgi:DNA-binding SARP family transcriptional activator/DNA-binding XRE family transcriptional regulator